VDIRINGADADRLGLEAVGSIFGADISTGPVRKSPPLLEAIKADEARWKHGEIVSFLLYLPPAFFDAELTRAKGEASAVRIDMHRVNIIANGKLLGQALRMDAASLGSLTAWEAAHALKRRMMGK
jgi:hypothetical protein